MFDRKTAIKTAHDFISDLRTYGYNPKEAWLFGSAINGASNQYSDIDLALWDEQFSGVSFLDAEKIKMLLLKYRFIELHPYNTSISEKEDPFIGVIKKTGERIL